MVWRSIQTFPRLLKSRSRSFVSSLLIPAVPLAVGPEADPVLEWVFDAAFTVETREEARDVEADPMAGDDREVALLESLWMCRLSLLLPCC